MPIATSRPVRPQRLTHAPTNGIHVPATPNKRITVRVLDIPFEMRTVAAQMGAIWDSAKKTYVWRGTGPLPDILGLFASQPYSWERFQEDALNDIEPKEALPTKNVVLHPHQKEGAEAIKAAVDAGRTGFLNADDVGLGKTMETWAAINDMNWAETVLIICPLSVVAHWRRTIEWMGDKGKKIVVLNYDRVKKLFEAPATIPTKSRKKSMRGRKVRTQRGLARFGTAMEFDIVIFDESHRLRNLETARSKFAMKLAEPAGLVIWLSATAGTSPIQLAYLAPLLSESTGIRMADLNDFEGWCQRQGFGITKGAFGKWSWVGDAKDLDPKQRAAADADLERMRAMLFDGKLPLGIRRNPSQIAGWPEVNRILLPVDLGADDRSAYDKIWTEFRDHLGLEIRGARDSKNGLVARLRFRQKASLLRTGATLDLALDLLAQGHQVAISVAFHETLDILREALTKQGIATSILDGRISSGAEKERRRLDFQYGRTTVCLYTVEEAISLHQGEYNDAPRSNLVHDIRWSAISMKQIEGRTHRDGKFSQVYWMLGADTIEEEIAEIVAGRLRSMSIMQGDTATIADVEKLLTKMAA